MRNRASYPSNWGEISKRIIKRAHNRCEKCGLENGTVVRGKGRTREVVPEERYIALKKELERKRAADRQAISLKAGARAFDSSFLEDVDAVAGYYAEGDLYEIDRFDELEVEYPAAAELRRRANELRDLGVTRTVLQVHHRDQDPGNNADPNLIALCQFCHGRTHARIRRLAERRAS